MKRTWLIRVYRGIILSIYVGIITNHYKDILNNQYSMESHSKRFFFVAQMLTEFSMALKFDRRRESPRHSMTRCGENDFDGELKNPAKQLSRVLSVYIIYMYIYIYQP